MKKKQILKKYNLNCILFFLLEKMTKSGRKKTLMNYGF